MTQKSKILAHLRQGLSITPLDALKLYGSFRLGGCIHQLKKEIGKDEYIETELVKNQNGNRYARYSLKSCSCMKCGNTDKECTCQKHDYYG